MPPTGVDDASPTKVQKREPIENHTSAVTTIVGSLTNTFILQHIPPRLQRARELLMRCVYRGAEAEGEVERGHLLTWEDLLQEVQASPEELRRGLENMGAVDIGGFWRIIEDACLAEVTQLVLGLCIENDWPSSGVPAEDCVAQLPDYCPHVIRHCIAFYSSADADPPPAAGTWSLDAAKVCGFVAKSMLESETEEGGEVKQFPEAEFMEEWNDSTPADMTPDATMLRVRLDTLALARYLRAVANARPLFSLRFCCRQKAETGCACVCTHRVSHALPSSGPRTARRADSSTASLSPLCLRASQSDSLRSLITGCTGALVSWSHTSGRTAVAQLRRACCSPSTRVVSLVTTASACTGAGRRWQKSDGVLLSLCCASFPPHLAPPISRPSRRWHPSRRTRRYNTARGRCRKLP